MIIRLNVNLNFIHPHFEDDNRMQSSIEFHILGIILIIVGLMLIVIGIIFMFNSTMREQTFQKESKGIILIGPIPFIWGFGKKGKLVALTLFLIGVDESCVLIEISLVIVIKFK